MFTEDHLKPGFWVFIISNEVHKHSVKEFQHQIYLSMWSYRITVVKKGVIPYFHYFGTALKFIISSMNMREEKNIVKEAYEKANLYLVNPI